MVANRANDRESMSVEEFLALSRNLLDVKYEYIKGYAYLMAGGTPAHSLIAMNIGTLLNNALGENPCAVFSSDAMVQLAEDVFVYPDVTVSCMEEDLVADVIRYPRVVVEVLSPSTKAFDQGRKFLLYQDCPGVEAVVFVESNEPLITVFHKEGTLWAHTPFYAGGTVSIKCLNVSIPVDAIYRRVRFR
jgi:Uma2 family endonuclease